MIYACIGFLVHRTMSLLQCIVLQRTFVVSAMYVHSPSIQVHPNAELKIVVTIP